MAASEASLLTAARRGDEPAFLDLYQRHKLPLYRFAYRLTGSEALAEDVTQECFLAMLNGAAFDDRRGPLRTYLFGVIRHLALRRLKRDERESEEPPLSAAAADANPLCELLAAERAAIVERAVRVLPPLQKEALILFEYEDMSLEEISRITGVDVNAVKARLFRARESLRRSLAQLSPRCAERSS